MRASRLYLLALWAPALLVAAPTTRPRLELQRSYAAGASAEISSKSQASVRCRLHLGDTDLCQDNETLATANHNLTRDLHETLEKPIPSLHDSKAGPPRRQTKQPVETTTPKVVIVTPYYVMRSEKTEDIEATNFLSYYSKTVLTVNEVNHNKTVLPLLSNLDPVGNESTTSTQYIPSSNSTKIPRKKGKVWPHTKMTKPPVQTTTPKIVIVTPYYVMRSETTKKMDFEATNFLNYYSKPAISITEEDQNKTELPLPSKMNLVGNESNPTGAKIPRQGDIHEADTLPRRTRRPVAPQPNNTQISGRSRHFPSWMKSVPYLENGAILFRKKIQSTSTASAITESRKSDATLTNFNHSPNLTIYSTTENIPVISSSTLSTKSNSVSYKPKSSTASPSEQSTGGFVSTPFPLDSHNDGISTSSVSTSIAEEPESSSARNAKRQISSSALGEFIVTTPASDSVENHSGAPVIPTSTHPGESDFTNYVSVLSNELGESSGMNATSEPRTTIPLPTNITATLGDKEAEEIMFERQEEKPYVEAATDLTLSSSMTTEPSRIVHRNHSTITELVFGSTILPLISITELVLPPANVVNSTEPPEEVRGSDNLIHLMSTPAPVRQRTMTTTLRVPYLTHYHEEVPTARRVRLSHGNNLLLQPPFETNAAATKQFSGQIESEQLRGLSETKFPSQNPAPAFNPPFNHQTKPVFSPMTTGRSKMTYAPPAPYYVQVRKPAAARSEPFNYGNGSASQANKNNLIHTMKNIIKQGAEAGAVFKEEKLAKAKTNFEKMRQRFGKNSKGSIPAWSITTNSRHHAPRKVVPRLPGVIRNGVRSAAAVVNNLAQRYRPHRH
ncbi:mucin-5AC-like [Hyalella azteca]|uniref:Mucin-5AC-like n=1 Tax=Hyalella azteca TaxID=294128 RepID=A0A979FGK5_HYAAZ|nr:mucin-5AC-like [Hyalella azteca]